MAEDGIGEVFTVSTGNSTDDGIEEVFTVSTGNNNYNIGEVFTVSIGSSDIIILGKYLR